MSIRISEGIIPIQEAVILKFKLEWASQGFTFLTTMAAVVIIGIAISVTAYQWKTMVKREKEKELLFRGNEIRSAIARYISADPLRRYPHSLADLIKDPRTSKSVRYLRKMYKDPINNEDWDLIMDPVLGLVGVHSKSKEKPLKTSHFKIRDRCFEGKEHYRDWLFVVQPINLAIPLIAQPALTPPGVTPPISGLPAPLCPPTPPSENK